MGEFYNNVAYNCNASYYALGNGADINMILKNNISLDPKKYHIQFQYDSRESNYNLTSNNNLFYPDGATLFRLHNYDGGGTTEVNFAGWQALSETGFVFDPDSILSDPLFSNANTDYSADTDFVPLPASLAANAGVNTGISGQTDYAGNSFRGQPDIGAYEFAGGGRYGGIGRNYRRSRYR